MAQAHNANEQFTHLLQPNALLPPQYFAALRRRLEQEPERRLIAAMLQDAVECFQKHLFAADRKKRQLFRDAEQWICSTDRQWPFSFENVCEMLQLDPGYIRQGLLAWKEAQLTKRTSDADADIGTSLALPQAPHSPRPVR